MSLCGSHGPDVGVRVTELSQIASLGAGYHERYLRAPFNIGRFCGRQIWFRGINACVCTNLVRSHVSEVFPGGDLQLGCEEPRSLISDVDQVTDCSVMRGPDRELHIGGFGQKLGPLLK